MQYLRKIVALTAIISIVLASTITSAANTAINSSTAASADGVVATVITITSVGSEFTSTNEIASAAITNLDGSVTASGTTLTTQADTSNDDTTSELVIATGNLVDNTSYIIAYTTTDGDFGTTTLRVGTPINDTLTVTASVEPVLKFAMESNTEAFGVLTTATGTVTTGLEVGTNAVNGLTISAKSTNGGLKSASASGHTIGLTGNDALYAAEGYYFNSTLAASADSLSGATLDNFALTAINTADQTETIYTAYNPQNFDTTGGLYDVDFTVSAKIAESTPSASDYTDVIIFTATANF